jgi:hypothetical protein
MFQGDVRGRKTEETLSCANRGEAPKGAGLRDLDQPSDMSDVERHGNFPV